ncbi:MAG: hypothetical protein AAGG51_00985 [Cyanobacteria bacterium P01_G01_bin.54]
MATVSSEQLAQLKTQLSDYPPALAALAEIEACEGDLEDAAMSLAIQAGQVPQEDNAEWLADLAKRCRALLCAEIPRQNLQVGAIDKVILTVANADLVPAILATPVVLFVQAQGLTPFCAPLDQAMNREE